MRIWIQLAIGVLLAGQWGCTPPSSISPPAGWVQVDARKFVFFVPPDVKSVPTMGIDSFVGQYKGDSISLDFDYGFYSDGLQDAEGGFNYVSHLERIDGKKARMASFDFPNTGHPFDYAIGVHFPKAGAKGIRLTVFATCKTKADYETAEQIF